MGEPWNPDYSNEGASVTESAGQIVIRLTGSSSGDSVHAGLVSDRLTRIEGARVSIQVAEVPASERLGRFAFMLEDPAGHAVELAVTAGHLTASRVGDAPLADVVYDPVLHRFWALQETGGTLFFATSAEGEAWTILARDGEPLLDPRAVRGRLIGSAHAGSADAGTIKIDDVNGGLRSGGWCPIGELATSFDAPELPAALTSQGASTCHFSLDGGTLGIAGDAGAEATCSIRTTSRYDLTGGQVVIEVPQASGTLSSTRLRLQIDPLYFIELATRNGTLVASKSEGAVVAPETPAGFDPTQHRFWRIREDQGRIEWATSPDRNEWHALHAELWQLPLDRFEVLVGVVIEESAPATEAHFDNLNTEL
jgi:hypothetical protein